MDVVLTKNTDLINDGIVVGWGFVVHRPAAVNELKLAALNKLDDLIVKYASFKDDPIEMQQVALLSECLFAEYSLCKGKKGWPPVFCLDSAALLLLSWRHIYLIGWILTSETGGQPYSDTSPYEVSECSLLNGLLVTLGLCFVLGTSQIIEMSDLAWP